MGAIAGTGEIDEELPLLGEAFAVELANSHYVGDGEDLDFLAEPGSAAAWFAAAPQAGDLTFPRKVPRATLAALSRVRDVTRMILSAAADADGQVATTSAAWREGAEILDVEAGRCPAHVVLEVEPGGSPAWRLHHQGTDAQVLPAAAASRCILFLGGEDVRRVRRCERSACPMLFVQRHRARRFCHDSCAHSVRQARYYRRSRSPDGRTVSTADGTTL